MGEIVKMDNGKDNEIMAMMNDASLCPLLEETDVYKRQADDGCYAS